MNHDRIIQRLQQRWRYSLWRCNHFWYQWGLSIDWCTMCPAVSSWYVFIMGGWIVFTPVLLAFEREDGRRETRVRERVKLVGGMRGLITLGLSSLFHPPSISHFVFSLFSSLFLPVSFFPFFFPRPRTDLLLRHSVCLPPSDDAEYWSPLFYILASSPCVCVCVCMCGCGCASARRLSLLQMRTWNSVNWIFPS